jgi:hypothetical protein
MLCREIIAVCSEIHTKHINKLCGQNVEFLNVKLAVHIVTTELRRVSTSCSAFDMAVRHGRSLFTLCTPSRPAQVQISHSAHS